MEKFFKVKPNNDFYNKYMDFKTMSEKIGDTFKEFAALYGIETNKFYMNTDRLSIIPTEKDVEKFKGMFTQHSTTDLKKTTKISRDWVKLCKERGITSPRKPNIFWDSNVNMGTYSGSSRLFSLGDLVLGSADNKIDYDFELTDEFEEIKASEFYKLIEDYEAIES